MCVCMCAMYVCMSIRSSIHPLIILLFYTAMEDNDIYVQHPSGSGLSFATFGHDDMSGMYAAVGEGHQPARGRNDVNLPDDDVNSMYAVVNKGQRASPEVEGQAQCQGGPTVADDELDSTYAVVDKSKGKGKKGKNTKGSHEKNKQATPPAGEEIDSIYAKVDKVKKNAKEQKQGEQKGVLINIASVFGWW